MKKLLILTNLVWLSFFVFTGFKPITENVNRTLAAPNYHLVDASLAKIMADNYRNNYIGMTRRLGKYPNFTYKTNANDSRSIWFSLDMLKSFIADIETQGSASGVMPSGLRFYYIQYPEKILPTNNAYAYFNGVNPAYQKLHSLMSVPTYLDIAQKVHVDYDPRKGSMPISQVFDLLISKENQEIRNSVSPGTNQFKANVLLSQNLNVTGDDSDPANVANRGQIIPPPYNSRMALGTSIPCSGANLMIYFDGYSTCGLKSDEIKKSEDTKKF